MRVGIIGAGAVGRGAAAFLARAGHTPILWSPSGQSTGELARSYLVAKGAIDGSFSVDVATSAEQVVADGDLLLLTLPAVGHRTVMDAIAPFLRTGQPVIISSHASFGALYLAKLLTARGVAPTIVAWGTTLTSGRIAEGNGVSISTVRDKVDFATLPESYSAAAQELCEALFGARFVARNGLMAIALSNLNPQNHLSIALLNLTRMERGEIWGQGENVTGTVGRLIEALDQERLGIARKLEIPVRTVQEHFSLSFHVEKDSVTAMNQAMHLAGRGGVGPNSADSRYVLEDVPFGLWPTVLLGRLTGQPVVLHEAGIALLSAAYGRNLASENDLLPALEFSGITLKRLQQLCRNGYSTA